VEIVVIPKEKFIALSAALPNGPTARLPFFSFLLPDAVFCM
jgi:hypothetical protein